MASNPNSQSPALARPWNVDLTEPRIRVESWGRALVSDGRVVRATHPDTLRKIFEMARRDHRTIALRGAGNSYSDAFQNRGGLVLDTAGMDRILEWDSTTGIVRSEPGLTIGKMWRSTLQEGWWPPVVTGTMFASFGGLAAMNAHGKNNFKRGTFGEHIVEFTILLPTGEEKRCSPTENSELYYAAIGGFGMLGCFTDITLKMKKVHSGLVEVDAHVTRNLDEAFQCFEKHKDHIDYFVGWFDAFATGGDLGRGIIHTARYLREGEDPNPGMTLQPASQELPERILGFPKSLMWIALRPFVNDMGMRYINLAKYISSRVHPDGHRYRQSLAAFSFLLDYVPNWKLSYGPGGLIQYQSFIPKEKACETYKTLIRMSHERGVIPYLLVFKRHRRDPFLLTHAVDGYSLAMDYRVTEKNRGALWSLAAEMDEAVHAAGGRFYFAKDATLRSESLRRIWPKASIDQFLNLKKKCDPDGILQTDLFRRVFANEI
ncbi:MAG: FAD-binding oxidoreductase [Planctomycetes bacterium]|nr:FAD-binding oxidoreductase [Planctomycetota bacterium]